MLKYLFFLTFLSFGSSNITTHHSYGYFFEHLGGVNIFNNFANIQHKINLTNYRNRLNHINNTAEKVREICNEIDTLYCKTEHHSDDNDKAKIIGQCHQLIMEVSTDTEELNKTLNSLSLHKLKRSKRDLFERVVFERVDPLVTTLFGVSTQKEINVQQKHLESLKSRTDFIIENLKIQNNLTQTGFMLIKNMEEKLFEGIDLNLTKNFKEAEKFMNATMERERILQRSNYMNAAANLLNYMVNKMKVDVTRLLSSESFAKSNIIHTTFLTPTMFLKLLQKKPLKNGISFPLRLIEDNIYNLWAISSVETVPTDGNSIILDIKVPLIRTDKSYDLVRVHSFPIISNGVAYLKENPKHKFYIFSKDNTTFSSMDSLENCLEVDEGQRICELYMVDFNLEDSDICEVALRVNKNLCNTTTSIDSLFDIVALENNRWLIMTTSNESYKELNADCKEYNTNNSSGWIDSGNHLLSLNPGCKFQINNRELTATKTKTKTIEYEFPRAEILDKSSYDKYSRNDAEGIHLKNIDVGNSLEVLETVKSKFENREEESYNLTMKKKEQKTWKIITVTSIGWLISLIIIYFICSFFYNRHLEKMEEMRLHNSNSEVKNKEITSFIQQEHIHSDK